MVKTCENHESPRQGLHWYGGGRKSMKEEKINAVMRNVMKIQNSTLTHTHTHTHTFESKV